MSKAPLRCTLKTGMTLVWPFGKDIEINVFNNLVYIIVSYNVVNISDGGYHKQTLIGGVNYLRLWLILQNALVALNGNRELVTKFSRFLK